MVKASMYVGFPLFSKVNKSRRRPSEDDDDTEEEMRGDATVVVASPGEASSQRFCAAGVADSNASSSRGLKTLLKRDWSDDSTELSLLLLLLLLLLLSPS